MRKRSLLLATITALTATLAACDESPTTPFEAQPDFTTTEAASEGTIDIAALGAGSEDGSLFDRLAREIPGFAGFWFDRGCNLNVVLTDPEQIELAKKVLAPFLRRYVETHRCPDTATIVVHRGEFNWIQLSTWLRRLEPVLRLPGVGRMGISVRLNRIVVAVDGRPTAYEVLRFVHRTDIPPAVIKFVLWQPTTDRRSSD